jgi:hypothetical protein
MIQSFVLVLNVLLPEEQAGFNECIESLKAKRKLFAVRRDIQHEGFRIHKIHKKKLINV